MNYLAYNLTHDKDNNTMMPIYPNHEAKVKEWLSKSSKKTGYQLVGYQFVKNWSGYQFGGYQFVGYQFEGYQFVGYQ